MLKVMVPHLYLTRTEDQAIINSNRAAACKGFCGEGSPDEYPFASTYEGGSEAFVSGVPIEEQRIQGGIFKPILFTE